jgi:hypothetical protein
MSLGTESSDSQSQGCSGAINCKMRCPTAASGEAECNQLQNCKPRCPAFALGNAECNQLQKTRFPLGEHRTARIRQKRVPPPAVLFDGAYALIDGTIGLIAAFPEAPRRSPPIGLRGQSLQRRRRSRNLPVAHHGIPVKRPPPPDCNCLQFHGRVARYNSERIQ